MKKADDNAPPTNIWVLQPDERAQLLASLDQCMGPDAADRVVSLVETYLASAGTGRFWDTACLPAIALAETARIMGAGEAFSTIGHALFELIQCTVGPDQLQQLIRQIERDAEPPL
jgi:hypothetical protein